MRTTALVALLALWCSGPALCQLPQSHPELCGTPNAAVSLPPRMVAVPGRGDQVQIFFGGGAQGIEIPALYGVGEACPLADGRLVVFAGDVHGIGNGFAILDPARPALLDTVWCRDAHMSPDQRWVVFRKAYFLRTDESTSDEYLRYDLSRSPSQNRSPGDRDPEHDAGTAIYPPGWKNEAGDNYGPPESQVHQNLSTFFWAPDSRALVFADVNQGIRSLVFIALDEKGATTASVFPFPASMECDDPTAAANGQKAQPTGLRRVEILPQQGADRPMFVDFEADGCAPKTTQLHSESFQPAKTEARVLPPPTHKAVRQRQ